MYARYPNVVGKFTCGKLWGIKPTEAFLVNLLHVLALYQSLAFLAGWLQGLQNCTAKPLLPRTVVLKVMWPTTLPARLCWIKQQLFSRFFVQPTVVKVKIAIKLALHAIVSGPSSRQESSSKYTSWACALTAPMPYCHSASHKLSLSSVELRTLSTCCLCIDLQVPGGQVNDVCRGKPIG